MKKSMNSFFKIVLVQNSKRCMQGIEQICPPNSSDDLCLCLYRTSIDWPVVKNLEVRCGVMGKVQSIFGRLFSSFLPLWMGQANYRAMGGRRPVNSLLLICSHLSHVVRVYTHTLYTLTHTPTHTLYTFSQLHVLYNVQGQSIFSDQESAHDGSCIYNFLNYFL